jgi:hypothetical protein
MLINWGLSTLNLTTPLIAPILAITCLIVSISNLPSFLIYGYGSTLIVSLSYSRPLLVNVGCIL